MSLSSKVFFGAFVFALLVAAAFSYHRYVFLHDYLVEGEATPEEEIDEQRAVIIPLPIIE